MHHFVRKPGLAGQPPWRNLRTKQVIRHHFVRMPGLAGQPPRRNLRTKQVIRHHFVRMPGLACNLRAYRKRARCEGANTTTHTVSGRRATAPIPLRMPYAGAVRRRQYHYACRMRAPCDGANTTTHARPCRAALIKEYAYEAARSVPFRTHALSLYRLVIHL